MSLEQWGNENPTMKQDLKILYQFVMRYKPQIILEVGTGHSTLAMLKASDDLCNTASITIHTTDIDQHRIDIFEEKMGIETYYRAHTNNKDSIKFLSEFEGFADLIFIDSSHEYIQTYKELEAASGKLAPNGYIIMHDVISVPNVNRAVKEFLAENKDEFKYFILKTECGLGVLQRI